MAIKWKFVDGQYIKVDTAQPKPRAPRAKAQPREPRRPRRHKPEVKRTCRNCRFIYFIGMKEVSLISGTCDNWKISGRLNVQCSDDACEHWSRRRLGKMANEEKYAEAMREAIKVIAMVSSRKKISTSFETSKI